ncbi:MAG: zinc-ribbon domain-containing protein [Clostridia bacterium]|nr:zinc-ribbon domain-containing protein [Clostridia bacterium]
MCHCVECTPWEDRPRFCSQCGEEIPDDDLFCRKCGARLQYREVTA